MQRRHQHLDDADGDMSVGEVAAVLAVSPGTVRMWESQGLISPPRDLRGQRRYGRRELEQLRRVRYLRKIQRLNAQAIRNMISTDGTAIGGGTDADVQGFDPTVGGTLRAMRQSMGLTLREASEKAGLSISFISSLERGITGASPSAQARLREVYEGHPLDPDDNGTRIHHVGGSQPVPVAPGIAIEWLSNRQGLLEPQLAIIQPGATSPGLYQHRGEEFLFIVKGRFRLFLGTDVHDLRRGDTMHFPSQLPHRWENPGRRPAHVMWVTTERGIWASRENASTTETDAAGGEPSSASTDIPGARTHQQTP